MGRGREEREGGEEEGEGGRVGGWRGREEGGGEGSLRKEVMDCIIYTR